MVKQPLYQEISVTALQLKQLELNTSTITRRLCVGYKTIVNAIEWIEYSEAES